MLLLMQSGTDRRWFHRIARTRWQPFGIVLPSEQFAQNSKLIASEGQFNSVRLASYQRLIRALSLSSRCNANSSCSSLALKWSARVELRLASWNDHWDESQNDSWDDPGNDSSDDFWDDSSNNSSWEQGSEDLRTKLASGNWSVGHC